METSERQVNKSSEESETEKSPTAFRETLKAIVIELCDVYRQELTTEVREAWKLALKDMSVETLGIGRRATLQRHKEFMPTPAQFREYAESAIGAMSKKRAHDGCPVCRGTGWRMVPRTDGPGEWAKRCDA